MAIKIKRSTTALAVPPSLVSGEIAINEADGKMYYRATSGTVTQFSTPTISHAHGNITYLGAIGSTSGLPIITTTSGVLTTGSFGTSVATFCEGNDSRLSDTRTPTDGSVTTAKLANDAVTYAKLQNVSATDRLLGRSSAGSGDVEEISCGSFGRSLIGSADAAAARTTLSVQPTASPAFTGAATFDNTGNVVPLTVTNTGTASSFVVNDASGDTSPFVIDAAGNVGIGTSLPTQLIHCVAADATLRADSSSEDKGLLLVKTGVQGFAITVNGAAQTLNFSSANSWPSIATLMTIMASGNVGVGTTTPGGRLEVAGGQLLVTAGSASACGVAFSGDVNTGLAQLGGADTASLVTAGVERVRVKATGSVRFVPLSADPSTGNEAGDIYYNSSTNKLRVYNGTSWVDLH